ncbi:MAG: hypothetical protein IJZ85_09570 [Lachnospiraceae bacterium]|nr:hypothetical protein [Lachnospiraceae bacterium]
MKKRIAAFILAVLMAASVMGGCAAGKVDASKYATTVIATFDGNPIYMDELNYYVRTTQYANEKAGFLESYGISRWTDEVNFYNIVVYVPGEPLREDCMSMVRQIYVMANEAEKAGISLSVEETANINAAVNEFLAGDEALVAAVNLSADRLNEIYTRNALANKMYAKYSEGIDTTVTDEEALQYDVSYLAIGPATITNLEIADLTPEKLANEIADAVNGGETLEKALEGYSDLKGTAVTMGNGDYSNMFGPAAEALEVGKAAAVESSSNEDTFYVVVRDSDYNEEATASKKAELEAEKISTAFAEDYPEWEAAYVFEPDHKKIEGLVVDEPIYDKAADAEG